MPKDGVTGQIDRLVLDISVKDGSGDGSKSSAQKISALDKALQNFTKTVKGIDTKGFGRKFASMTNSLNPFVKKIRAAQAELSKLNRLTKSTGTQAAVNAAGSGKLATRQEALEDKANGSVPAAQSGEAQKTQPKQPKTQAKNISELSDQYGKLRKRVTDANGVTTLFFENYEKDNRITKKFSATLGKNGNILNKSLKELGTTVDDLSGDSLKAFFLSLKRIAMYRAIRTSLSTVVKLFKQGIGNVIAFDETTRHAMSEISSSFTVIKNSFAMVFAPLIELVAPFVRVLAKQLGEVANIISLITAKLRGQGEVLQVNTEYFEEINKQSHLLDFDQFSVLSNMDNTSGMFSWEKTSEVEEKYKGMLIAIQAIATLLLAIEGFKLIKWLIGGGLGTVVKLIKGLPTTFSKLYGKISPVAIAVIGIAEALEAVHDIINWDETTSGLQKVFNILTVIFGVIAAIAAVAAAFLPTGAAKIAKAIGFTAVLLGLGTTIGGKIAKHADGGMFEGTGTMYHLAGESGAEIVASGSRGTGVTNISQFKTAMVQALAEYGVARQDSSGRPLVVELDGKEIARSQVYNNANELMRNYNLVLKPR